MDDQVDRLTTLPHELLHNIFKHVDPLQLAGLTIQCRALRGFISNNTQLFKEIFVKYFVSIVTYFPSQDAEILQDEPPEKQKPRGWDWEEELHKFTKFRRILGDASYQTVAKKASTSSFTSFRRSC